MGPDPVNRLYKTTQIVTAASNVRRIHSLLHRWSSGRIRPCHGRDPGSIPGRCRKSTIKTSTCFVFGAIHFFLDLIMSIGRRGHLTSGYANFTFFRVVCCLRTLLLSCDLLLFVLFLLRCFNHVLILHICLIFQVCLFLFWPTAWCVVPVVLRPPRRRASAASASGKIYIR